MGVGISGRGEEVGKRCGRVNIMQTLCTPICKWKKCYLLKLFQEWEKERIKENGAGGEFKYGIC
jgi:hypothetical protein